ncbi:BRISC and BRCA1-A complex member 2 isoform X2 [Dromaius novaehollandiae]|uniref:BRISC and BRCA1-A complex member 2 isoform X2 n=1 Tax=Dromaius novaehollandiae TaxID=8790 RepID=UPI00311D497B
MAPRPGQAGSDRTGPDGPAGARTLHPAPAPRQAPPPPRLPGATGGGSRPRGASCGAGVPWRAPAGSAAPPPRSGHKEAAAPRRPPPPGRAPRLRGASPPRHCYGRQYRGRGTPLRAWGAAAQDNRKEERTKMSPEVALNRISPALSPFISSVVRNGKVGLDATNCLRITDLKSGCTSLTPGPSCDRFKLHIPYAGETLKWDIIFNAHYPDLPPDFIFGEDAEFLPDPSALHNLASWNPSNPECLLLVVKELVQQYHQFQCSRLRESSRLMFEYQTLLEEPQYGENMEIYAGKKNNWTGEFSARFLLKLPVDFSNIPTYLLKDVNEDPGEDVALLSVSFEDAEATQVFPKLYLSPRIEHALGGSSALHIPAFPGGGCLIDYVPQVCQLLTNKVQYVIQGYHKRREYIAAFLSHFGTGVVEYDAEGFTKLTLLLMWKDFCFLVHIDLPLYFPRDQPTLTFQSVYHFTNSGQLYSQAQKNYPYSPRWDGNEMAKRAKAYFKTFVPQFQEAAFANGKL